MILDPGIFAGAGERADRFARQLRALDVLATAIDTICESESTKLKVRDGEDRLLSLIALSTFGKAQKTFRAIRCLCLLGYGEDATLLVRSSVNLLVNLGYILADKAPNECAADFYAYSYRERVAAGDTDLEPPFEPSELSVRAKRWGDLRIKARALKASLSWHYDPAYKLYSSIEHSDVFALGGYLGELGEARLRILSAPNDTHVGIALAHSFAVTADVMEHVCKYYGIERPEIFERLASVSLSALPHSADQRGDA